MFIQPYSLQSGPNISFLFSSFRGEGEENEKERNINVWLPRTCPLLGTWPTTQACALMGKQPFGLQAGTQSTEPHQPGPDISSTHLALYLVIVILLTIFFMMYFTSP